MEEKIKDFFEGPGKEATKHLGAGASIIITTGQTSYVLRITDRREVVVEKDGKGSGEIEIKGNDKIMNDLLSSSSLLEFTGKMKSYIVDRKGPEVKILMERTTDNSRKFLRIYFHFLRKVCLLK